MCFKSVQGAKQAENGTPLESKWGFQVHTRCLCSKIGDAEEPGDHEDDNQACQQCVSDELFLPEVPKQHQHTRHGSNVSIKFT